MTETVRTMAVVPLDEYKKLTRCNTADDEDEQIIQEDQNEIPHSLGLILECAPSRTQRQALLILKYMAQLGGRLKYDEDTGEVVIDQKHQRGSNLCDMIRILLSNRPGYGRRRNSSGMKAFLRVLADSALPANLIRDDHWRKYFNDLRSRAAFETDSDTE